MQQSVVFRGGADTSKGEEKSVMQALGDETAGSGRAELAALPHDRFHR